MFKLNGVDYLNTRDVEAKASRFCLTKGDIIRAAKSGGIKDAIYAESEGRGQWLYPIEGVKEFIKNKELGK